MPQAAFKALVSRHLTKGVVLLFVALLFACGSSATATPVPSTGGDTPAATEAPASGSSASSPTAVPKATEAPEAKAAPAGVINMGQKETGIFEAHPSMSSSPRIQFTSSSVGEGLITTGKDLAAQPMLAASWEISDNFLEWTWHFQENVEFHKGYGNMTAEDVLYSYQQWNEGALHARSGIMGEYFSVGGPGREGASVEIIDDHTLWVNTGTPWVQQDVFEFMRNGGGSSSWVVSKKQSEEIGIEEASKDIAATGPWEIQEHASGEYWKMSAVKDHWRQTPAFDGLIYWTIPDESARVAGFQTGQ